MRMFKCFLVLFFVMNISVEAEESMWFSVFDPKKPGVEFESEHMARKIRNYRILPEAAPGDQIEGYHLDPTGNVQKLSFEKSGKFFETSITTPWEDGPLHGPNLLYAVSKKVENQVLVIRTAKWLAVNHSCAWGHKRKYDSKRHQAWFYEKIPLEIIPPVLWDLNFHSIMKSGDMFRFEVRRYGKEQPGASLKIETGAGWQKQLQSNGDGRAEFQMVRDYYSNSWRDFNEEQLHRFKITAVFEENSPGTYNGAAYNKIRYVSTFSWKYQPSRYDFSSLTHGMSAALGVFLVSVLMVFLYREKRLKPQREIYLK